MPGLLAALGVQPQQLARLFLKHSAVATPEVPAWPLLSGATRLILDRACAPLDLLLPKFPQLQARPRSTPPGPFVGSHCKGCHCASLLALAAFEAAAAFPLLHAGAQLVWHPVSLAGRAGASCTGAGRVHHPAHAAKRRLRRY